MSTAASARSPILPSRPLLDRFYASAQTGLHDQAAQLVESRPQRRALHCLVRPRQGALPRRQLLCVDEVGCNKKAANRTRGSSKRGLPAVTHLNVLAGGRKYSGLGIFSESGFEGMHVVDGAFNRESFLDAIDRSVVRSPCPAVRAAPALDHTPLAHNRAPDPWQLKHMTPWPGPRSPGACCSSTTAASTR